MIEQPVTIINSLGLHARPAALLVKAASQFTSEVKLGKDDMFINGKSIMGVMMLAAECGSVLRIRADGPDEAEAVAALMALVNQGFNEE